MKYFAKFRFLLPILPLVLGLYFVINDFWMFMVISVPKYAADFGYNANPFLELERYNYYPAYFAFSVLVLILLLVLVILKRKNLTAGMMALSMILVVYMVHLNGVFIGYWIPQTIYDMTKKQDDIFREKVRMELLECRQNQDNY